MECIHKNEIKEYVFKINYLESENSENSRSLSKFILKLLKGALKGG